MMACGRVRRGLLTCVLASEQVLALGLVGVDGGDGDFIFRVGVQVLQDGGVLVAVQDGLMMNRAESAD